MSNLSSIEHVIKYIILYFYAACKFIWFPFITEICETDDKVVMKFFWKYSQPVL